MRYWLVKTEPSVYSVDDLERDGRTDWTGVRNFQARNFLKEMQVGDEVLVYHSNAEPPAVVGIAKVVTEARPDRTQFDRKSEYFDEKASQENPRWFCPDLAFVRRLERQISLDELRGSKALAELPLVQRGTRLSVLPVTAKQFEVIVRMAGNSARRRASAGG